EFGTRTRICPQNFADYAEEKTKSKEPRAASGLNSKLETRNSKLLKVRNSKPETSGYFTISKSIHCVAVLYFAFPRKSLTITCSTYSPGTMLVPSWMAPPE